VSEKAQGGDVKVADGVVYRERRLEVVPPNGPLHQLIIGYFREDYRGHAIDIGAADGVSVNSTYLLEKQHGWRVICVEPNPELADIADLNRFSVEHCACGKEPADEQDFQVNIANPESHSALKPHPERSAGIRNWVTFKTKVRTVDQILEKWEYESLDVLCLDVEGAEQDVLEGCDLVRWAPKVIVVEAWQVGEHDAYLREYGYRRRMRSADNDLYVKEPR